ncbi:glycosyltransferase, partial [Magnetospirillum sp. 15-1]|uniref:glycosyltransferase n=1 Tax=Magnetospirillum sp. 15-1 TaxID=1979370 RepID=UPI0011442571
MAWVRVIIVNYNGGDLIGRTLSALAAQTMADFEAVIVDNASTDGSADNLTLPDDRFRLICAGANLGFAAGNNLGARGCTAPWIATLNPDARPRPDWLDQLCRASERHAGVGVFGSTQLLGDDGRLIDGFGDV